MRGEEPQTAAFFSYLRLEDRIPADHPLRTIRTVVDAALAELSRTFDKLYARDGRPSIPPEQLLRALLLQPLYTVRSERQLMEQINYNLLFRWFVGLSIDNPVWDATTFCKNRTGFWTATLHASSWPACWTCRESARCCRASISRLMAR